MNRIDRMELIGWTEELCQRNEVVSEPFQMSEEPQVLKLGLSILIVLFELGLSKTPTEEHDRIPSSLNTL